MRVPSITRLARPQNGETIFIWVFLGAQSPAILGSRISYCCSPSQTPELDQDPVRKRGGSVSDLLNIIRTDEGRT